MFGKNLKIILASVLLVACGSGEESQSFLATFEQIETVEISEVMPELKSELHNPSTFCFVDRFLILSEPNLDSLLLVYDFKNQKSKRLLLKGQGEDEALKIQNIAKGPNACSCSLHDMMLQKVFWLDLATFPEFVLSKDSLVNSTQAVCALAYDGCLSFHENVNKDKRFTMVTPDKKVEFGNDISVKRLSSSMSTKVLQGPCSLSASRKKFFWFSAFGDVMEIYDYSDTNHIELVKSLVCSVPNVSSNGVFGIKDKLGVASVTSDNDYIYALYIGKTLGESLHNKGNALYGDKILVFDWEGNSCRVLDLNREVLAISYSSLQGKLYALGLDDEGNYSVYEVGL